MSANQYTQKSMEAIQAAQALAGEYGNQELGQAHLLAALTENGEGLIPQLLTHMGTDAGAVHGAALKLVDMQPRISGGGRVAGQVYVTSDMDRALREAAREAEVMKDS